MMMHPSIHQTRYFCSLPFVLGIYLLLMNHLTCVLPFQLDNCTDDWQCDYWKTDKVCPYSDGWDCFIYYYTNTCPSVPGPSGPTRDSRCDSVELISTARRGDPSTAYSCYNYEDYCLYYTECSNFIDPKDCCYAYVEPFFIFGCYCSYVISGKVSIMLNNGIRNYSISHTLPNYYKGNNFTEINTYTVPKIDCIDKKEPPFNLTIQDFCFACNYDGVNTSYTLSLAGGADGIVQNRSVPNLDLIKRPKRYTNFRDCISETYELEKGASYGEGVIQVSTPGTYTWNLKVKTSNRRFKNYNLKYDFVIDGYCNSSEPVPKKTEVPTKAPTGVPTKAPTGAPIAPKKTMNISIYQEFETNVWTEIVKSSSDKIENVCIKRGTHVTIQAYPDEKEFGVPTNVTFELIRPKASSYAHTEGSKPFLLYGDLPKINTWYGRKWFWTGIYTIKITPKYASSKGAAIAPIVKTINVTKIGDCVRAS